MRRPIHLLLAVVALALLIAGPRPALAEDARGVAERLGRGVNVLGYDPLWKDPAAARFKPRLFAVVRNGGFQTLRVNLQAFAHMDADNWLDPRWLQTLDGVVRDALGQGLNVIIDEHDYNPCGEDPAACRPKLLAFWSQVAERYKDAPPGVVFEILNEPNRGLTAELWNGLSRDALAVIRRSNPTRAVIIGPVFWNNLNYLDRLELPEADRNIIVTFHYYIPMEFTHQGASWVAETSKLSGVRWGSEADYARLNADFDKVQAWARAHDRPILLGEFGAYDKGAMEDRARYTAAVARAAEARGWPWAYWQFDSDFIAYDIDKDRWVEPIRDALIPAAR